MGLAAAYKRWRHGRGFGVHSPYAYRFVTEVLNPQRNYGYYAYGGIARRIGRDKIAVTLREAFLVYRIMLALRPSSIAIADSGPRAALLRHMAETACPGARIANDGELLICMRGARPAQGAFPRHSYFADASHPALHMLISAMEHGHVYRNPDRAVTIGAEHLPFQTFEIAF